MLQWIENGAALAWLIDPEKEQVFIYRADNSVEIMNGNSVALSFYIFYKYLGVCQNNLIYPFGKKRPSLDCCCP